MKKRRIKKTIIKKGLLIITTIIIIIIISIIIKTMKYHKTDEYKLKKIGYNIEEIKQIENEKENINYILNNQYNEKIPKIITQKYYLKKNFERYINYSNENPNKELEKIISLVNVGRDNDYYTNTKTTNTEKKELMLVNKYNYLENTYEPQDIITIPSRYAYSGNKTSEEALEYYKKMFADAEKDGIKLIISSAYRSYEEQQKTYDEYKKTKKENIDKYAARPGYSEHQTGFAFDILTTGVKTTTFETTKEYEWLQQNAYKYGFILRYPKDKEEITGYEYESWHYRYVGQNAAQIIKNENITFDEYYAYYVENN